MGRFRENRPLQSPCLVTLRLLPQTIRPSSQPGGQRTTFCSKTRRTYFSYPIFETGRSAAQGSRMLPVNLPLAWSTLKKTACISTLTIRSTRILRQLTVLIRFPSEADQYLITEIYINTRHYCN